MSTYGRLGIRRVINAAATLTALGGSIMPTEVLSAMGEAASAFIDLEELQVAVGARIADLTNNEAGYVTSGAAAGITHAVAACIAGSDPRQVQIFPSLAGVTRREVVMARSQRNGFDYAARLTGATIVETDGTLTGLGETLCERTACVLCFAGARYDLDATAVGAIVDVAHERGVPVIVDAAAQVPPISSLWTFTRDAGADAVIVSGGKGLRGPQSSGLVLGSQRMIEGCRANGNPHATIGRPMKVGKEELIGLLAAVEWYLAQDEAAMIAGFETSVRLWNEGLAGLPGVTASRGYPNEAGQPFGRTILRLGEGAALTRSELVDRLWHGDPRVAVGVIDDDAIALNAQTLLPGEDEQVLARLKALLRPAS